MSNDDPASRKKFSLRDYQPTRRIDRWHEVLDEIRFTSSFRNLDPDFHGEFVIQPAGALVIGDFHTSRGDVFRTNQDIAKCDLDSFIIFQQRGIQGSFFSSGTLPDDTFLSAGDIVIANVDAPFASRNKHSFHHRVAVVPRALLAISSARLGKLEDGMVLRRGEPLNRILSAFLDQAWDTVGDLPTGAFKGVADAAASLLAAASGARSDEAAAVGQLAVVQRRIRAHLRDPLLTPSRIADECGFSLRKLHGLFESSEDTFGSFVRRARLDLARQLLSDPRSTQAIADLAVNLGFNSLATFYRVYRDAFGETPGDTRATALGLRK